MLRSPDKRYPANRVPLRAPRNRLTYRPPPSRLPSVSPYLGKIPVTVCAAALFTWSYDTEKKDFGAAIVAFSDRMLTDEALGIEYQGGKWKAAIFHKHMILVSGPFVVHSECLLRLDKKLKERESAGDPAPTTVELANLYARTLRDYKREQASQLYLEPLTLDKDDRFISQQKLMDSALVADVARQLQDHEIAGNPEALVIGCDGKTAAHLYRIGKEGLVTCHDDIGFVSIGTGGIHATAHFMLEGQHLNDRFYKTLFTAFSAKKKAEVAPGVGDDHTDMFVVTRDGVVKQHDDLVNEMKRVYAFNRDARKKLEEQDVNSLMEFDRIFHQKRNAGAQPTPAKPAPADGEEPKTTDGVTEPPAS